MRVVTIIVCLLSIVSFNKMEAQTDRYRSVVDSRWKGMTGTFYILPFFIDSPYGEFEEAEIEHLLNDIDNSKEWILEQADEYSHVELEIITDYFKSHEEKVYNSGGYSYRANSSASMGHTAASYLGFDNIEDYISFNQLDVSRDRVAVICFVKQQGRSHTFNYRGRNFSEKVNVDHTVVFCGTSFKYYSRQNMISHKILHMFGAWDLSRGEPQNSVKARALKRLYPNSIMVSTYGTDFKNIDEINAWRLGWNLEPKEFFLDYEPQYEENIEEMERRNKERSKKEKSIKFDLGRKNRNNN